MVGDEQRRELYRKVGHAATVDERNEMNKEKEGDKIEPGILEGMSSSFATIWCCSLHLSIIDKRCQDRRSSTNDANGVNRIKKGLYLRLVKRKKMMMATNHRAFLYDYYNKGLYPFDLIYRMLVRNKKEQSAHARLFGVQYQTDSNVYQMYEYPRSTCHELKQEMLASSTKPPESLHMAHFKEGEGMGKFMRAQKELVFDMDITDFTRYCVCNNVKRLCPICWCQIQGASLILQHLLEEVMGYERKHCLWVFSGNKGVHCFVNQPSAMKLGDKEREQLHKRFNIVMGDDARLIEFIASINRTSPSFFLDHVLKGYDLFDLAPFEKQPGVEESFELSCLRHLNKRHPGLYSHVKGAWDMMTQSPSSSTKKARLETGHSGGGENISMRKWKTLQQLERLCKSPGVTYYPSVFLALRLMYPVIDPAPLKMSHQIKLPFSVHSISHNVALPVTQEGIMKMDILKDVLPLDQLCRQFRNNNTPRAFEEATRLLETWLEKYEVY